MASEKDLIRRGDVLELLYRLKEDKDCVYGVESVLEYAESLPTVDAVEVVHGEWIKVPEHGDCYYKCSKCGKTLDTYYESDYAFCARCGADMRSEEE